MKITTVLFDLDGTLLPMKQEDFMKAYFESLARKLAPHGYEKASLIASILAGTKAVARITETSLTKKPFGTYFQPYLARRPVMI